MLGIVLYLLTGIFSTLFCYNYIDKQKEDYGLGVCAVITLLWPVITLVAACNWVMSKNIFSTTILKKKDSND